MFGREPALRKTPLRTSGQVPAADPSRGARRASAGRVARQTAVGPASYPAPPGAEPGQAAR